MINHDQIVAVTASADSARPWPRRAAGWLDVIIFIGALVLIAVTVIPYGTVDPWWEAVFECSVFILAALWIIESLLFQDWRLRKLLVILPLVLLTAYAFVQLVAFPGSWFASLAEPLSRRTLTIDRYQTYLTARKTLALTLFTGILLLHTSTSRRLRWVVRLIIGIGLASALFGIIRQLSQTPDAASGFVLPFLFPGYGYGEFISSNVFAYLIEMVLALLLGVALGGGARREWLPINLAIAVVLWTSLVLSNSRGGLVGLTCASIFIMFVALRWHSERKLAASGETGRVLTFIHTSPMFRVLAIILLVITLAIGMLWMGGEKLAAKVRAENTTQDLVDGTTRGEIWRSTWELIKQQPLTGTGLGTYFLAITKYQNGSGRIKLEQAHNEYLDLAANGGVIAVGFAVWFMIVLIRRVRPLLRSTDPYRRAATLGAVAGIIAVSVHSLVDFGLQVTGLAVVFCGLAVVCMAETPEERVPHDERQGFSSRRRAIISGG